MRLILIVVLSLVLCEGPALSEVEEQEAEVVKNNSESLKGKIDQIIFKSESLGEVKLKGSDVQRILLAAFRPFDDKAQKEAEALIKQLGDDDPAKRDSATEKLKKMGPSLLPLLQKHQDSKDQEVKSRIEQIIPVLKEITGRKYDTVAGKTFVVNGFITLISVDGKELDLKEVKTIKINVKPEPAKGNVFYLVDGSKVLGNLKKGVKLDGKEFEPKDIELIKFEKASATLASDKKEHKGTINGDIEAETPFGGMTFKVENLKAYKTQDRLSYIEGMSFIGMNKQGHEEYEHDKTGMIFVLIPGGTFKMGSDEGTQYEKPVHEVKLSDFLIAKYEVTQEVWEKIMGKNPSHFKGKNNPVEQVRWEDCQEFCKKTGLRLPTEAEWEYACRAGTKTKFYWGDKEDGDYMWYHANSESKTHPVGKKKPNEYGLHDMSGNVLEWCQDWWDKNYYENSSKENPKGPEKGQYRVVRGGDCYIDAYNCRSSYRRCCMPSLRHRSFVGFRSVASVVD